MKKLLIIFTLFMSACSTVEKNDDKPDKVLPLIPYPSWDILGETSVSKAKAYYPIIAIDNNDVLYMAYQDSAKADKITVKKFNGTTWEAVGLEGFSRGRALYIKLAIDKKNNIPYVAYKDMDKDGKATVKKLNGSTWVTVGSEGFTIDEANFISLAIDSDGIPYIAYIESENVEPIHLGEVTVKKFDGSIWETVGIEGVSDDEGTYPSLAIDNNGVPYIVYINVITHWLGYTFNPVVKKFNGSSWVDVGQITIDPPYYWFTHENNITITIDAQNVPYVSYYDKVKKFNGSSWEELGVNRFHRKNISIAINQNSELYMSYQENHDNGGREISVTKYNGKYWDTVGEKENIFLAKGKLYNTPSLALNKDGKIFVAYQDVKDDKKVYVKYFLPKDFSENSFN